MFISRCLTLQHADINSSDVWLYINHPYIMSYSSELEKKVLCHKLGAHSAIKQPPAYKKKL